jgi:hypothetical protein
MHDATQSGQANNRNLDLIHRNRNLHWGSVLQSILEMTPPAATS